MKNTFIKNLTTIGLTLSLSTFALTGCSAFNEFEENKAAQAKIADAMSTDANVEIFKVQYMTIRKGDSCNFVDFKGHYDTKFTPGWHGAHYENHKDYIITYKIDDATYDKLSRHTVHKESASLYSISLDGLKDIQYVIDNYDVFDVSEIEDEDEMCK